MIMKKDGVFFSDAWYYHVCDEMGDEERELERVLFDDLRKEWKFVSRGCEVDINFCPYCGEELRRVDPGAGECHGETGKDGGCPEEVRENSCSLTECSMKCMFCAQDVSVHVSPKEGEFAQEECMHCQAKIKFDVPA